ncbi:hypothetical protein ACTFIY_010593 [Dictyostelium cf. discoideum]
MSTYNNNNNEIKHISNKWIFEIEDLVIESHVITGTIPEDILIFVNGQPTKRVVFEGTSLVCSFSFTPPHVLIASTLMIPLFPLIVAKAIMVHKDKVIHVTKDFSKSNNDNILYQQTNFNNTNNIFNNNNNNDSNSINYIDSK